MENFIKIKNLNEALKLLKVDLKIKYPSFLIFHKFSKKFETPYLVNASILISSKLYKTIPLHDIIIVTSSIFDINDPITVQKEKSVIIEMKILRQFGFVIDFDLHRKLDFCIEKLKLIDNSFINNDEKRDDLFRIFSDLFMCPSIVNYKVEDVIDSAISYQMDVNFRNPLIEELINLYEVFRNDIDPYK
ncbi:hypothetical protein DMUE_1165 [Dictyocoela muelleri]|nr:hypothetical protein DMUE_1165 [Dictyocoela muelleri]